MFARNRSDRFEHPQGARVGRSGSSGVEEHCRAYDGQGSGALGQGARHNGSPLDGVARVTGMVPPGPDDRVPRGIADHVRGLILRGGLAPGDRLPSQRSLAEQFGVSRASVREAISALESTGLVLVRVGSGVYVAPPSAHATPWRFSDRCTPRDVYEARLGLESFAAGLAAARAGAARLQPVTAAIAAMATALAHRDLPGMAAADARFHDIVFDLAGNPVLTGMYGPVRDMMVESQRLPLARRDRLGETLAEHQAIASCLARGDADGASEAMRAHIRAAAGRYGITIGS